MAEVTKEDIGKVHSRLDSLVEEQTRSRVAIGRIETILQMMPPLPTRPCPEHNELRKDFDEHIEGRPCLEHIELQEDFDEHIETHRESKRLWQRPLVAAIIDLAKMAAVAGFTYLVLRLNGRG